MAASKCLYHGPGRAPVGPRVSRFRSCKSMDGLKSKPLRTPEREAVLEKLERIYGHSGVLNGKNDVLAPGKPRGPGAVWEGKPVRVAYQGERGSYCHEAAVRAFQRCDALPFGSGMQSAFEAVESGAVDRAVVPVENSLDGVIDRNYDLLLRHQAVRITGELLLRINHCLLGVDGMSLKRVVSHPQALDHCRQWLLGAGVAVEAVDNAATAARFVAENRDFETGVVGSVIAGREFGLRVVEQNVQDDSSNTTRFFILGKNSAVEPIGGFCSMTTVAFSLEGGAADLFEALSIFALREVKVSNIQSRPLRENPLRVVDGGEEGSFKYFGYVFFVDLEGSTADPDVEECLDRLRQISIFVKVLGTYNTDS